MRLKPIILSLTIFLVVSKFPARAQEVKTVRQEKKALMHDTLDGKFDFSRFLIDAHGFIPVPFIITEPALGGFGAALAPLFLSPKKGLPKNAGYVPPDITAGFGMYTVNGSWALGAFRMGSFPKSGIKYRIGGGYANVNMSFYSDLPILGEKEFKFNIHAVPMLLSVSKKVSKKGLYTGVQYLFSNTTLYPEFSGDLPDFISEKEMKSNVASLGLFLDWDLRNSVFTPDKGIRVNALFNVDDNWTGSDYSFQKLSAFVHWFFAIKPKWISGLRVEGQQAYGSPPFYLLPFVNLRGIPVARYQGRSVMTLETEQRFDLSPRWSMLGFVGYAKTVGENQSFSEGKNVYNLGGGFRYLIARAFKIRTGIDIAMGPDSWGWYIVFGHNWNR